MDSPHDQSDGEMEIIKVDNELSQMASKGEWDEVVNIYRNIPKLHKAIINRSGDTVLHRAVSDGKEEVVEQLITEIISPQGGGKEALEIKNEQGNTPLHAAASMGNVRMCQCIAQVYPSLAGVLNVDGETPLLLAALNGKKEAFLCLLDAAIAGDIFGEH
jgi:ankyrin repeat protein